MAFRLFRNDDLVYRTPRHAFRGLWTPRHTLAGVIGLVVVAGLFVLSAKYTSARPGLAAERAIAKSGLTDVGNIDVTGWYRFRDSDGSARRNVQLVCGRLGQRARRDFAAVIREHGSRRRIGPVYYTVMELAVAPGPGEPPASPGTLSLLGACGGG